MLSRKWPFLLFPFSSNRLAIFNLETSLIHIVQSLMIALEVNQTHNFCKKEADCVTLPLSVAVDPSAHHRGAAGAMPWNPGMLPQQPEPPAQYQGQAAAAAAAAKPKKPSKVARQVAAMNSSAEGGEGTPQRMKRITNTDDVYTIHKTAEGQIKFRCKMCHRCFNLKCTLLRHVRHQHQGRFVPHPCPQCGQVFKRTDHLKVHLKKIHQIEQLSSRQQARLQAAGEGSPAELAGEGGLQIVDTEGEEGDVGSPMLVGEIAESPIAAEEEEEELEEEIAEPTPA